MTVPTTVPTELIAGDTWRWTVTDADHPAPTWAATWYFESPSKAFSTAGAASGADHAATVSPAASATYPAGDYYWQMVVSSAGVRETVARGWTRIQPDPAAAGAVDHRTTARVVLDMIDAYLRDPTNLTAASYSLGGRSLSRWSRSELLTERDKWKSEAASEERAARLAAGIGAKRLSVRF